MTITEVSREYGLSADTLRYYERIGLIPDVNRTQGGIRDYTEGDCRWVGFAKCMRNAGLPIEAIVEYVALYQQGSITENARKNLLVEQRDLLVERIAGMQQALDRLNSKIDNFAQIAEKPDVKPALQNAVG